MSAITLLNQIAAIDRTFHREDGDWVGKRLICSGPLRFDAPTGEGGTIEHFLPRSLGGGSDLSNLGVAHRRCNGEKGRRWDAPNRRRGNEESYAALVELLRLERALCWRDNVQ